GRGGCYTCRLRRKKCDEMSVDGSCLTCIRLRLQCLGFGPTWPEWMRDKITVDEVKKEMSIFMAKQGLVRGGPSSSLSTGDSS
ncbi:hypothetical protein SCHPADRAFT_795031, partial [Schizopora paradoxa]